MQPPLRCCSCNSQSEFRKAVKFASSSHSHTSLQHLYFAHLWVVTKTNNLFLELYSLYRNSLFIILFIIVLHDPIQKFRCWRFRRTPPALGSSRLFNCRTQIHHVFLDASQHLYNRCVCPSLCPSVRPSIRPSATFSYTKEIKGKSCKSLSIVFVSPLSLLSSGPDSDCAGP